MTSRTDKIKERLTAYLSGGGLFNPELANHEAVRELIIDCRAEVQALEDELVRWQARAVTTEERAEKAEAALEHETNNRLNAQEEIKRLTAALAQQANRCLSGEER